MTWQTDRSRILDGKACRRRRWHLYHSYGKGLQRIAKALPLVAGGAFHEGAEAMLTGQGIELAVQRAHTFLDKTFADRGVDLETEEVHIAHGMAEQKAVAEALLRSWWAFNGERFLRDFEILEVEVEGAAALEEGIELLFRPDALIRERQSGDSYALSWKTCSTFGDYTTKQIAVDMQPISETWGREQSKLPDGVERIEGTVYVFAVKGKRPLDKYLGFKSQDSHLVKGWLREGPTLEDSEWAWCYGWETEEFNTKTGKMVSTKLGKGFRKVAIWEKYPGEVKQWVEDLSQQQITPRHINALEELFPQSLPVTRRVDEVEDWKEQTIYEEQQWEHDVEIVQAVQREGTEQDYRRALNRYFPQATARCNDYNHPCAAFDLCWKAAVASDPIGSQLYQIRISNHPEAKGDSE